MRKLLYFILKIITKKIIKKYRPFIIAITGSVGKTSAKEAIYSVVAKHHQVRKNEKNYNNEIGVPLTVIGANEPGGKSIFKWFKIFIQGLKISYKKPEDFPEMLILEYGADRPGDIDYLLNIVPCDIGVLTAIAPVHLEFFGSLENVFSEKSKIITKLANAHIAVFNGDDSKIKELKNQTKAKVFTYGFNDGNNFRAQDVKISHKNGQPGMSFKLKYDGKTIPVFLPNILGKPQVFACLAAIAVGRVMNINVLDIIENLQSYKAPKGRTNLIEGIKNSTILDDSYNSSPTSASAALEILSEIQIPEGCKRVAVLGDMLELGNYTEQGHQQVGEKAANIGADLLIVVGEKSRDIIRGAIKAGMPEERTAHFNNNHDAGIFVQEKIHQGDIVLIKGSQGARMEQIVKELMAEPMSAEKLLVRQSEEWLKK
ncbi:UDP-N-acetylmuramoyl-tripeptide--D-alanyl-D-alanine ligase [Patescibacteria group bacterium]|nr:UDP-N-acetylmuramoyl-tripeptide--D-alanyl-D-alanine ligase [Patescibacteria group bacterium]